MFCLQKEQWKDKLKSPYLLPQHFGYYLPSKTCKKDKKYHKENYVQVSAQRVQPEVALHEGRQAKSTCVTVARNQDFFF